MSFISITGMLKQLNVLLDYNTPDALERAWELYSRLLERFGNKIRRMCTYLSQIDAPLVKILLYKTLLENEEPESTIQCDFNEDRWNKVATILQGSLIECFSSFDIQSVDWSTIQDTLSQCLKEKLIDDCSSLGVTNNMIDAMTRELLELITYNPCYKQSIIVCTAVDHARRLEEPVALNNRLSTIDILNKDVIHYSSLPFVGEKKQSMYSIAIVDSHGTITATPFSSIEELAYILHNAGIKLPFVVEGVSSLRQSTVQDVVHIKKYEGTSELPETWEWFDGMTLLMKDASNKSYRLIFFVEP